MMLCPQCKKVYGDDVVFCLDDGNALIDDAVEQETVINQNVRFSTPGIVTCSVCGLSNTANSKFCQKCGAVFTHRSGYPNNQSYGETVGFVPPMFTPPVHPVATVPSTNKNIPIIILAALSIILVMVILFMMSGGGIFKTDGDQRTHLNNANSDSSNSGSGNNTAVVNNKNSAKSPKPPVSDDSDDRTDENPQKDVPSLPSRFEQEYRGRSDRPLTLSLKKNGSSLSGTATTPGDLDYLEGTIQPNGTFDLAGNNRGNGITGHWRGRIEPNGSIRGIWTANNGRQVPYSAH